MKRVELGAVAAAIALVVTPVAGAESHHYFRGKLENYRNPACYWTISEDCSYYNYWVASVATIPNAVGSTDIGFDWGSGMAGFVVSQSGSWYTCKTSVPQAPIYNRASVAYWSGGDNFIDDAYAARPFLGC